MTVIPFAPQRFAGLQSEDIYDIVCHGCDTVCNNCSFEGTTPFCAEELDHSFSAGGNVTLEMLSIEEGYWRATDTSEKILACYNADACRGGLTGAPEYCEDGYEGPCELRMQVLTSGVVRCRLSRPWLVASLRNELACFRRGARLAGFARVPLPPQG